MRYDTSFQPPAPVLPVVVRNPYIRAEPYSCLAILDTGAEISAIPRDAVVALRLAEAQRVIAGSWDGSRSEVSTFVVQLEFAEGVVPLLEVAAAERATALIGRDLLNAWRLLLDGPALDFEILPSQ